MLLTWKLKHMDLGTSLAVQWLRFGAFTAEGVGSIPGWVGIKKKNQSHSPWGIQCIHMASTAIFNMGHIRPL